MKKKDTIEELISKRELFYKISKREILESVKKGYVVFYDIDWDTDGEKIKLPKVIMVLKTEFEEDFDFFQDGADYLSDNFEWCVNSFDFEA